MPQAPLHLAALGQVAELIPPGSTAFHLQMNAYGCSLVYGHPQGPTGARLIVELLHTLRLRGGGVGLFTGCAAGDTGAAVVVRVQD